MADALSTLLGMNSPSNMSDTSYTPNIGRNSARVGVLRKFLGMQGPDDGSISQADYESAYKGIQDEQDEDAKRKAELATLPERVRGEYGLQNERLKGQYQVEAAKAQADRLALSLQATAHNQELNRNATNARSAATQAGTAERAQAAQAASAARQQAAQNEARAKLIETGKVHAARPANEGLWGWLTGKSQKDLDTAEVQRLRSGAGAPSASGGGDNLAAQAGAQYAAKYGHLDDDSLRAVIAQTQPTATPEEHDAIFRAARGIQ